MKVGIIIHSHTGNTLRVAEKIKNKYLIKGCNATILRVSAENEEKERKNIVLKEIPDCEPFDIIIFGAPVWGFSVSPVMKKYLISLKTLKGKKVGCYITQGLPKPWMGGSRSVNQMVKLCKSKGAEILKTELISWKGENLEQRIDLAAEKLSSIGY